MRDRRERLTVGHTAPVRSLLVNDLLYGYPRSLKCLFWAHRASPKGSRAPRRPERRLRLQRPGHLPRVRHRHRRRLPRTRHQRRRRHRRLRLPGTARGVLRPHGRRQRRPQGLHRALLQEADRLVPRARARHHQVPETRDRHLVRAHHPADPGRE